MYPFDIINSIQQDENLRTMFGPRINYNNYVNVAREVSHEADFRLEDWMIATGRFSYPSVARYLDYLVRLNETVYYKLLKEMSRYNDEGSHVHGDDRNTLGVMNGLFPLAGYLYYLDSFHIKGDILECGCFKGCSTSVLSWAANALGRRLYAADSFEGLPEPEEGDTRYYSKGNFKGRLDEVQSAVARCGAPWAVEYVVGWYKESLKGWAKPLMCIWIDVDLYSSTLSVLENSFFALQPGGVLFVDGLAAERDYSTDGGLKVGADESRAMLEYFSKHKVSHLAKYSGVDNLGLVIPHTQSGDVIRFSPAHFNYLLGLVRTKILGWSSQG